jgi:hypothetical protein
MLLLFGALLALFVCVGLPLCWLTRRRLRQLADSRIRGGEAGGADFVAYCSENGLHRDAIRQAYHYLQGCVDTEDFPIRLDDALCGQLKIDRDEIEDIVIDLARICGCGVQWDEDALSLDEPTVRDLLDLVIEWRGCKPAKHT